MTSFAPGSTVLKGGTGTEDVDVDKHTNGEAISGSSATLSCPAYSSMFRINSKGETTYSTSNISEDADNAYLNDVLNDVNAAYKKDLEKGVPVYNSVQIPNFHLFQGKHHIAQSTLDKILVLCLLLPSKDGHYELVKTVVSQGANVNWASFYGCGQRPVHFAARFGHIKSLKLLLKYNANTSLTDDEGRTALHIGAIFQNISIVRFLIENGVNVRVEDIYGRTALHAAIESIQGIEKEITETMESKLFYLRHTFDMIDRDGHGHALCSDIDHVLKNYGIADALGDYRPETRIHFDEFLACITPKQKNQLLQRTVKAKIDSQNELITLLLKTYPSVEAKLESLNARDHHGQVAFGLSARRRWYVEHYTDMQNIFRNPVEAGFDSAIFQDPRTMLAVQTEWNSTMKQKRLLRWYYHQIFTIVMTFYVFSITWQFSRQVAAFEVGMKQALVYQEYDEHNTEGYFDIESIEEWWQWSENVLMKELYPSPAIFDNLNTTSNQLQRRNVNRHLRGHNNLFGKLRLRIIRQFPVSETEYVCETPYAKGKEFDESEKRPCFNPNPNVAAHDPPSIWTVGSVELKHSKELPGRTFSGKAITVSDHGYVYTFGSLNKTQSLGVLRLLHAHNAVNNLNTRVVLYDFVVRNDQLGLFCVVTLATEAIVSGTIIPNARFQTYQMLPIDKNNRAAVATLAMFMYLSMIHQVWTWWKHWKTNRKYYKSELFRESLKKNPKYKRAVRKWFYPYFLRRKYAHSNLSFNNFAEEENNDFKMHQRKCFFDHSEDHVCKHQWTNPNTGHKELTFERHCTQYLVPVPLTEFCLVLVESEIPRGWNMLRGYGGFFFDKKLYWIFMTTMYLATFVLHISQFVWADDIFSRPPEDETFFSKIYDYSDIIKYRNAVFSLLLFINWLEALRNIAVLFPTLMTLMMIIQGMTYKLAAWAVLSIFAFIAFASLEYVTFGSEKGIKTASEFLIDSFVRASGEGEFQIDRENLSDTMIETGSHVIFIILFPIIVMNLLIAFMSEAYESVKESAASRFCYMQFEQVEFERMAKRQFTPTKDRSSNLIGVMMHGIGLRGRWSANEPRYKRRPILVSRVSSWGRAKSRRGTMTEAVAKNDSNGVEGVELHGIDAANSDKSV